MKELHTEDVFHEPAHDAPSVNDALDPDRIAEYLRQHPDFFIDYENLLPDLALPHHTGEHAISLVERQVSVLRSRNRDVRQRLGRLLDTARDNDRLFQKTQKLVLAILEQRSVEGVVDAVESSLRDDYQVDACRLLLLDAETLAAAKEQVGALLKASQPVCGHLRPQETEFLFVDGGAVRSAAVTPIVSVGAAREPIALLAIGSFDPEYYRTGMGTLFLTYVADILARVLPRCQQAER
jgi:uncharacterized protein YigA (DUF484 family)